MVGLPNAEKNFEDVYNHLDRILLYDRWMDREGQTSCHGIVRTMHTRHAVKMAPFFRSCCNSYAIVLDCC